MRNSKNKRSTKEKRKKEAGKQSRIRQKEEKKGR